jgi:hypothetical protein
LSDLTFDETWKKNFEGLLYLGKLEKEVVSIPLHKFVVRTLTVNEQLEVLLITQPYADGIGYSRAYKAAVVAAGLVSVDGQLLIATDKNSNVLRQKWDYVTNGWYEPVVDVLYDEIDQLHARMIEVCQEIGVLPKDDEIVQIFVENSGGEDPNPKE